MGSECEAADYVIERGGVGGHGQACYVTVCNLKGILCCGLKRTLTQDTFARGRVKYPMALSSGDGRVSVSQLYFSGD